ncbi:MAG: hypothetical protein WCO42_04040 [bacterium]
MSTISNALKKAQIQRMADMPDSGIPHGRNWSKAPDEDDKPVVAKKTNHTLVVSVVVAFMLAAIFCVMLLSAVSKNRETQTLASHPDVQPVVTPKAVAPPPSPPPKVDVAPVTTIVSEVVAPVPQPARVKPQPTDLPTLNGTFYSERNPVAIINGFSLKEGETVGQYQVVKILPQSVILKSNGDEFEIKLK